MNDLKANDSMLMPPPPPRVPKRQKRVSSFDVVAVEAAGELMHPDSISIPPLPLQAQPQNSAASGGGGGGDDNAHFSNPLSGDHRAQSVSPDEIEGNGSNVMGISPVSREGSVGHVATNEFETGGNRMEVAESAAKQSLTDPTFDGIVQSDKKQCMDDDLFQNSGSENDKDNDPSTIHDSRNEISTDESITQNSSKKDKQSRGCDSHPPVNVSFRDIIGHGQAKLRLDEALLPLALPPDLADSVLTGIRAAPASILLHGPPGCGKTKLAKAVAGEAQAAFLSVGPSDILSKFVGESEASIRGLFREARRKARKMESRCAVVFFDEIDALGRSRVDQESGNTSQAGADNSSRRLLAELLIQMTGLSNENEEVDSGSETEGEDYDGYCDDGGSFAGRSTISTGTGIFDGNHNCIRPSDISPSQSMSPPNHSGVKPQAEDQQVDTPTLSGEVGDDGNADKMQPKPRVIVVAATNRPEDCDPALLRRFAVRVFVGLPSRKDRRKIIHRLLCDVKHSITPSQLDDIALATERWSGSDLESMTREAVMAPVRECLRAAAIHKKRVGKAIKRSRADVSQTSEPKRADDTHNATRESLLESFQNLRPVSSNDFEDGIAFFLGELQDSSAFSHFENHAKHAHYDSSSSSEDEE